MLIISFQRILVYRSPEAMRAATAEVRSVLEGSHQKADPANPQLVLTREQLDNMPVLGKIIFRCFGAYNVSVINYDYNLLSCR